MRALIDQKSNEARTADDSRRFFQSLTTSSVICEAAMM